MASSTNHKQLRLDESPDTEKVDWRTTVKEITPDPDHPNRLILPSKSLLETVARNYFSDEPTANSLELWQHGTLYPFTLLSDESIEAAKHRCPLCSSLHSATLYPDMGIKVHCPAAYGIYRYDTLTNPAVTVTAVCPTCETHHFSFSWSNWMAKDLAAVWCEDHKTEATTTTDHPTHQTNPNTTFCQIHSHTHNIRRLFPTNTPNTSDHFYLMNGNYAKLIVNNYTKQGSSITEPIHIFIKNTLNAISVHELIYSQEQNTLLYTKLYEADGKGTITYKIRDITIPLFFQQINTVELFKEQTDPSDQYIQTVKITPETTTLVQPPKENTTNSVDSPDNNFTSQPVTEKISSETDTFSPTKLSEPKKGVVTARAVTHIVKRPETRNREFWVLPEQLVETIYQHRRNIDSDKLAELKESIANNGQLVSCTAQFPQDRPLVDLIPDNFALISGHRRVAAIALLNKELVENGEEPLQVRIVFVDVADSTALKMSISDNINRDNFNPLDEADAFQAMITQGYTPNDIATEFGKRQQYISERLALLDLPEEIQTDLLTSDTVKTSHLRELIRVDNPEIQKDIIQQVKDNNLTTRETKKIVDETKQKLSEQRRIAEALHQLELYLSDEFPRLFSRRISLTEIDEDESIIASYYDLSLDDLLFEANVSNILSQWFCEPALEQSIVDLFDQVGLKLIDAAAVYDEDDTPQPSPSTLPLSPPSNLCPSCIIPFTLLDKPFCPFNDDLSQTKTTCKFFSSCSKDIPSKVQEMCLLCKKKIKHTDRTLSLRNGLAIHQYCSFDQLKLLPQLNIVSCKNCKKRGNCSTQQDLYQLVKKTNYTVTLSIDHCEQSVPENSPDKVTLSTDTWSYTFTDDGNTCLCKTDRVEEAHNFMVKNNLSLESITIDPSLEEEHLAKLRKLSGSKPPSSSSNNPPISGSLGRLEL